MKVQSLLGDRVGRDVFFYSITLDPDNDTPAELKKFAQAQGVKPGWLFLTGKAKDIEALRRKLGLYDPDPRVDAVRAQHTGLIRVGNEALNKWAANPILSPPELIVQSIERMKPVQTAAPK